MTGPRFRYLGPVILIDLCLVTLCAVTAMSLLNQQAALSQVLRENVESRRAAVELEECLTDLIALEHDRVETVAVMHDRVTVLMRNVRAAADQIEERELCDQLERNYAEYLRSWQGMPPVGAPGHEAARDAATYKLETAVLKPCQQIKLYNARRIETSAEHHERVLTRLAWGMAGVGGLGAVAGMLLGWGVARGLARSIRRLRVQIQDAAGKLAPSAPEIVLTGEGDFEGLHAEMERLERRVEQVVRALREREGEVLRAEQLAAVGQLAAGVAHEIRNPLTSIKMLVQAGLEDAAGLAPEDLRVIEAEVRRTERSLQVFLDFARPPKPERRPTELTPLIRGVIDLIRGRAERQRVDVRVDAPPEGVTATIDGEQLRQVLVNLSLNALDVMPTGGVLTVAVRPHPLGRVEIEVTDTGPGISHDLLPRLFLPFVSTKDTGLGLGLVVSRRIVEDHGGTVVAGNRHGGGARFRVTLPIGHPEEAVDAHAARS